MLASVGAAALATAASRDPFVRCCAVVEVVWGAAAFELLRLWPRVDRWGARVLAWSETRPRRSSAAVRAVVSSGLAGFYGLMAVAVATGAYGTIALVAIAVLTALS